MGVGTRLPSTELTFLSDLGATGWAPHCECLLFGDSHDSIMQVYGAAKWSILTSATNPFLGMVTRLKVDKCRDCRHSLAGTARALNC